jgi:hypothetical protein
MVVCSIGCSIGCSIVELIPNCHVRYQALRLSKPRLLESAASK